MTPRDFFFAVTQMRAAQKDYIATRDDRAFRAARRFENEVDREIQRVKQILCAQQSTP